MVEDIDLSRSVSLLDLDSQLEAVVNRVALALDHQRQPNTTTATLLADILRTFLGTHNSIRLLISRRETAPTLSSDAVSLVREQIEKVFLVSLLSSRWDPYVRIYYEEDWCRLYRYFLIEKREQASLERQKEFFNHHGPQLMNEYRLQLGIGAEIRELIEFQVANPGRERPNHLKQVRLPHMPTPKEILDRAPEEERDALDRWYEEYKLVCGYTHIGADKLYMTTATGRKISIKSEVMEHVFTKKFLEKLLLSYVATAYVASELISLAGSDLEVMAATTKFWNALLEAGISAKIFWELRSRNLFPLVST